MQTLESIRALFSVHHHAAGDLAFCAAPNAASWRRLAPPARQTRHTSEQKAAGRAAQRSPGCNWRQQRHCQQQRPGYALDPTAGGKNT